MWFAKLPPVRSWYRFGPLLLALVLPACSTARKEVILPPPAPAGPTTPAAPAGVPPAPATPPAAAAPADPATPAKIPAAKSVPRAVPKTSREKPAPPKPPERQEPLILAPTLADQQRGKLEQEVATKLRETEQHLAAVDHSHLTGEQTETLTMIQGFMNKAKEALSEKDVSRALNLAEKAQTLSGELPRQNGSFFPVSPDPSTQP